MAINAFNRQGGSFFIKIKGMKFSNRLKERRKIAGLTQKSVGDFIGISKMAVSRWELGYSIPRGKALADLAQLLDCTPKYLLNGDGEHKYAGVAMIDFYNSVSASAGNGYMNNDEDVIQIPILQSVIDQQSNKESVCCIRVSGNSMEPVLGSGSVIALNPHKKIISDGMMYVIRQGDLLRVKILIETPNDIIIRSYNRDFDDEIYSKNSLEDFEIIGQVFWYSSSLNV